MMLIALLLLAANAAPEATLRARYFPLGWRYVDDMALSRMFRENPAALEDSLLGRELALVGRVARIDRDGAGFVVHLGARGEMGWAADCHLSRHAAAKVRHEGLVIVRGTLVKNQGMAPYAVRGCRVVYDFTDDPGYAAASYEACLVRMMRDGCAVDRSACDATRAPPFAMVAATIARRLRGRRPAACPSDFFAVMHSCDEGRATIDGCHYRSEILRILDETVAADDGKTRAEAGTEIEQEHTERSGLLGAVVGNPEP